MRLTLPSLVVVCALGLAACTGESPATGPSLAVIDPGPTCQLTSEGIQPPINTDGSSVFKLGRVVPVKVRLTDCNGVAVDTVAPQVALAMIGAATGDVNELVSASAADEGTTMRPAGNGQYIFNLSTKLSQFNAGQDLQAGRYRLTITAPGLEPAVTVEFSLRP